MLHPVKQNPHPLPLPGRVRGEMQPIHADMLSGKEALAVNGILPAGLLNLPVVGHIHRAPCAVVIIAANCLFVTCQAKFPTIQQRNTILFHDKQAPFAVGINRFFG